MSPTDLDDALRQHLQANPDPADAGFSLRVMARLPAQPSPALQRGARALRYLHWTALSLAAISLAVLTTEGSPTGDPALAGATLALLVLLCFWAIPSRWSRG